VPADVSSPIAAIAGHAGPVTGSPVEQDTDLLVALAGWPTRGRRGGVGIG
jgi:hypothetical protein